MAHSNQRPILSCILTVSCLLAACKGPQEPTAFEQGQVALNDVALDEALVHFNQALSEDPQHMDALYSRGIAYWLKRDFPAARGDFDAVIQNSPEHTYARYYRALSAIGMMDYEQGVSDLTEVTTVEDPEFAREDLVRAYRMLGIGLLNLEQYDEALESLSTCVRMEPDVLLYYLERGGVYEALGKAELAVADYETLVSKTDSTHAMAREALSRLARLREIVLITNS